MIPGSGRSPREGKDYLLQYSGLENSMDCMYSPWGCKESDTTEWPSSSWGTRLSSFFTFAICFKCWTTIEWLMLSSLATSCVVVRESALMSAFNWSLSISDGQPLHFSSSKLLSPFQNFLHYHCSLKFINRSWVKCIIDIANCLCLKNKILNSKKKIARICFLSSIISLV